MSKLLLPIGVKLDSGLNFQGHFHRLMSTLNQKILLLCKLRPFIDNRTAVIIYKAQLLSLIEYGSIFIDDIPVNYLNKLQRVQNRCLRICNLVDKYTSNVELHLMSKILPLRLRRKLAICKFLYKKIRLKPEILVEPVRKGNRSSYKRLIYLSKPRTNGFRKSLSYAGYLTWNNLPVSFRLNNDYNSFKRVLKKMTNSVRLAPYGVTHKEFTDQNSHLEI